MKSGKILLFFGTAGILFSSCKKEETLSYTCVCKSSTTGSTYEYVQVLNSETQEEAKELCESFAKPPSDMYNTCGLELE